jgi:ribosomal protein S21
MLLTGGDGSSGVKFVEPNSVRISVGGDVRINVTPESTAIANHLSVAGDLQATAGFVKSYQFTKLAPAAASTPMMSSSFNGTYDFIKIPMRAAGSVIGVTLYTENGSVAAGAITGSVGIDDVLASTTSVKIGAGKIGSVTLAKDALTFAANSVLSMHLTSSAAYNGGGGSWMAIVDVEYWFRRHQIKKIMSHTNSYNYNIDIQKGDSFERALKKFTKKVKNLGIIQEHLDKTSFHQTKSQKKRIKKVKNMRRLLKKRK